MSLQKIEVRRFPFSVVLTKLIDEVVAQKFHFMFGDQLSEVKEIFLFYVTLRCLRFVFEIGISRNIEDTIH